MQEQLPDSNVYHPTFPIITAPRRLPQQDIVCQVPSAPQPTMRYSNPLPSIGQGFQSSPHRIYPEPTQFVNTIQPTINIPPPTLQNLTYSRGTHAPPNVQQYIPPSQTSIQQNSAKGTCSPKLIVLTVIIVAVIAVAGIVAAVLLSGDDEKDKSTAITTDIITPITTNNCDSNQFVCASSSIYSFECLPNSWRCDNIVDCTGGEDEDCTTNGCPDSSYLYCGGTCVSSYNICDGLQHCSNGADETNCQSYCPGQFFCSLGASVGGYCISYGQRCNGITDCLTSEDEANCTATTCPENYLICDTNKCITPSDICDKQAQCNDGKDEENCVSYCTDQFYCSSGSIYSSDTYCIISSWHCDSNTDCNSGEDEMNCPACKDDEFECVQGSEYYGNCIPSNWKCDNIVDCVSGTDEDGCSATTDEEDFRCPNVTVNIDIKKTKVCDGVEDCPGGRDEDNCIISTNGGTGDLQIFSVETLSHHKVCKDNWNSEKSLEACRSLGYSGLDAYTFVTGETGIVCGASFDVNAMVQNSPTNCTGHEVVQLMCTGSNGDNDCGVISATNAATSNMSRIVGGVDSDIKVYPWQISLQQYAWSHICGGTIVSKNWVVTAAHCVGSISSGQYSNYRIVSGITERSESNSVTTHSISKIVYHPTYTSTTLFMDVAVIKTVQDFTYSDKIQPACLPSPGQEFTENALASISGWGATSSGGSIPNHLQAVQVPYISYHSCREDYSLIKPHLKYGMICAGYAEGGKDTCQGDSGGPMVLSTGRWILVGITSWGIGCAAPNQPGVYTNTAVVVDWIERELKKT